MKTIPLNKFNAAMLGVALMCISATQLAVAADTLAINKITSTQLAGNVTELRMDFNDTPPQIQAYQIDQPSRLVVDMPATKNSLNGRFYKFVASSIAESYSIVDNPERTRVTFTLKKMGNYTTRVQGNSLFLKFAPVAKTLTKDTSPVTYTPTSLPERTTPVESAASVADSSPVYRNVEEPVAAKVANKATNVSKDMSPTLADIDFKKGPDGEGDIIVNLGRKNAPVDVSQQGSKIVARFLGTKVPERLRRRLDVSDFSTTVTTVDAFNEGANGVLIIQTQGGIEQQSFQSGERLTIAVKRPKVEKKAAVKKDMVYTGQKLSLNFQDIEVRQVLQLIADFTNLNLVASDSVKDRITIRLQDVPWDQALDIILRTKGLSKRRNGNVILIAPAEELNALEKKEVQAVQQAEDLAPLQTEYLQLSFAKAADVVPLIDASQNTTGGGSRSSPQNTVNVNGAAGASSSTARNGLLSSRGTLSVDVRTNTLIVQDTSDRLDEIRAMLQKIDVPVRQVMIEARIVRATDNFSKELGVKWGVLSKGIVNNNNLLVGGRDTTLFNLRDPQKNSDTGGYSYTIDRPDNLSVDMGVTTAGASSLALGLLNLSDLMIDLELSALQADGKGEVIATPKVLTTDKQKARVASGTQIPYTTSAGASGATSISFVNAELSLEVTPNITSDGRIGMELFVNSDSPSNTVSNGAIAINTNRVATNVLVEDGQTVVLGGIFQNVIENSTIKVPFLGDLPMLGRLFRRTVTSNNKQELLIFVTPHLVNDVTKVSQ